jgi:hypothetical protein
VQAKPKLGSMPGGTRIFVIGDWRLVIGYLKKITIRQSPITNNQFFFFSDLLHGKSICHWRMAICYLKNDKSPIANHK